MPSVDPSGYFGLGRLVHEGKPATGVYLAQCSTFHHLLTDRNDAVVTAGLAWLADRITRLIFELLVLVAGLDQQGNTAY